MRRSRLGAVPFAALAACLAIAGCGGDKGDVAEGSSPIVEPAIAEPPGDFAAQLAATLSRASSKRDCRPIEELNERSAYDFGCPLDDDVARSLRDFEVVGAQAYGTGGVVDYRTKISKDGASMTLSVTPEGEWAVNRFGLINEPSVGTSDADSRKGYDKVVDAFLAAVRDGDCHAYLKAAITSSPDPKKACREEFPFTKPLRIRLKTSPPAEPEYLGGNEIFGFYGLALAGPKPSYWTVGTVTTPKGSLRPHAVMNVNRGPLADERTQASL